MNTCYELRTRVVYVSLDGIHKKTINIKLLKAFMHHEKQILFNDEKTISPSEQKLLNSYYLYHQWCDIIKTEQPHLHRLIHDAYPLGSRKVISHDGQRHELILNNSLKVKCPERLYHLFEKLQTTYSNY